MILTKTDFLVAKGYRCNSPQEHNDIYAEIMDWKMNKITRFVDLIDY